MRDACDELLGLVQLQVEVVVRGHERAPVLGVVELELDAHAVVDQALEEGLRVHRLHHVAITGLAHRACCAGVWC